MKRFYKTINDHRILCTCNYKLSTTAHSSITLFFFTVNIVHCSGVLREKKRKFIPKPGMVYNHASASGVCNIHTYVVTYFIGSYYTGRLFKVNATSNNLIVN